MDSFFLLKELQGLTDLFHLGQLSTCVLIVAQVFLVSHENDGHVGTEVLHLRSPLLWNILCIRNKAYALSTEQTQTEHLAKTIQAERKSHPNCQGCRWRNTWGWRLCLDRTEASVGRSPPDPLCPREPAPPGPGQDNRTSLLPRMLPLQYIHQHISTSF